MPPTTQTKQGAGLPKPVRVVETGEVYESRASAARSIGCSPCSIYQALRYGTPVEGFHLADAADALDEERS